jgi:hypothetical protein
VVFKGKLIVSYFVVLLCRPLVVLLIEDADLQSEEHRSPDLCGVMNGLTDG